MPAPADEFDDFYKSARTALLQQTFALTGDLPASRSAVRDAFVAAWHHWRKVSRLEDPEAWVRPLAWRHAQRRHSARIFHRDRKLDPEIRATLDALAKLPLAQRKVLLLTQLTDASMADMAREVGLPLHEAEQRLQTATSQFAMNRDGADDRHPAAVRAAARARVRRPLAPGHHRPPRGHDPAPYAHGRRRRRGRGRARARRRGGHRRPGRQAVARERPQHRASQRCASAREPTVRPPRRRPRRPRPTRSRSRSPRTTWSPSTSSLERVPGRWRQAGTDGSRTGILMPCQSTRFADPEGTASAVQRFKAPARKGQSRRSMVQTVEMSTTNRSARAAYDAMLGWFGGCSDARVQLISTYDVDRVGDAATLLVLRSWKRPETTMVAGVARTGRASTVTFTRTQDVRPAGRRGRCAACSPTPSTACAACPSTGPCAEKPEVAAGRARAGGRGARHAQRGRPAAGRRRRPALDRHRGPRRPAPTWPPAAATPPASTPSR